MTQNGQPRQPAVLDAPVTDADNDLLGITPYAGRLAEFVDGLQPPFTIGVYGAWGAGKTTFVRLMEASLLEKRKNVKFIAFNAWPYKTADDLWRALVQTIAYELHEVGSDPEPPQPPPAPVPPLSWRVRLGSLLRKPALQLRREPEKPGKHDDYYELLARLDRTGYGGVRRTKSGGSVLDDEAALVAMLKGTVAALGSLSPVVAAMRGFFGLDGKVDAARLLKEEKNEITRTRIASVEQFREVVKELFDRTAKDKLVCIFIDDLDRCMPDAAIDLLEALKIFLGHINCVFIVAADEELIGQGLRIRYKELLELATGDESVRLFARKGKEYFEKIIQLGIRVPEPASDAVHRFISAQFPQWLPATDLIRSAIGTNPRRLKQYCTLLTYKYMVARAPEDVKDDSPLLNKLIELQSWSPNIVPKLRALTGEEDFEAILQRLEHCLAQSAPDEPRKTADAEIAHTVSLEIYDEAVMSTPLQRLFSTGPLLSSCARAEVAALASFVDVAPEPETATMLRSRDRVLMRILDKVTRTGVPSEGRLLLDDVTKLFLLDAEDPLLASLLVQLAETDEWQERTHEVETALDAPAGTPVSVAPPGVPLLQLAKANEKLRQKLLEPQRLSTIPRQIVTAWASQHASMPPSTTAPSAGAGARAARLVESIPAAEKSAIETAFLTRIRAARHFIKRRKFVKLDALGYAWPEVAEYLRTDLPGIRAFEANVVDPDQRPQDLPLRWQTFHDERLNAFLRLRPLLRDIYADELSKFLKLATAVVPPQEQVPLHVQSVQQYVSSQVFDNMPRPTAAAPVSAPLVVPPSMYTDVQVKVGRSLPDEYTVTMEHEGKTARVTAKIDPRRLDELRQESESMLRWMAPVEQSPSSETRMRSPELTGKLRDLGRELYAMFFRESVADAMREILGTGLSHRFFLDLPPELTALPWEVLHAPSPFKLFLGLTTTYSIVRVIQPQAPRVRPFSPPLRILAVFASPIEGVALKLQEEEELLRRILAPSISAGHVTLDVLKGGDASHDELQRMLRRKPHLFHFSGHGGYEPGAGGALMLDDPSGARMIEASHLAMLLHDSPVLLAVLSGCNTGSGEITDASTSVAGAVTHAGVPMVIGTTRAILDDAGLVFTRDFYRALVDGYTVEASLIEARKAQSVEKWDWSAFALFGTGEYLDDLRLDVEDDGRVRRP